MKKYEQSFKIKFVCLEKKITWSRLEEIKRIKQKKNSFASAFYISKTQKKSK